MPITPTRFPGVEPLRLIGGTASGTTPQVASFTLPHLGAYLLHLHAWTVHPSQAIEVMAVMSWFKYLPSGGAAPNVGYVATLGTAVAAAAATANALTVAAPNSSGVFTVSVGWGDGASHAATVDIKAIALRDANELLGGNAL